MSLGSSPRTHSASAGPSPPAHSASGRPITIDLTGVICPLNWVRTRLALENLEPGASLRVRLDPGEALDNVPRAARDEGHGVAIEGEVVTIVKS